MIPVERLDNFHGDPSTDINALCALGQIPGSEIVYIYGHSPAIPGGSTSIIWPLDSTLSASNLFPTAPTNCYISSSSAADIGMILKITVIDSNWEKKTYGVSLNGQAAVALPIQIRRVIEMENAGSTTFAGAIYAGTEAAPVLGVPALINTMNYMDAVDQISHTAIYTVPLGYKLLVTHYGGGTPTNDSILINAQVSNPGTRVFKTRMHSPVYRGTVEVSVNYFPLPEKTDIYLTAKAYTNNSEATGFLFGILLPKEYSI